MFSGLVNLMPTIQTSRPIPAHAGFTLVEVMIVVAVIGVLAAFAFPAYQDNVARSKVAAAVNELAGAKAGIDAELALVPHLDAASTMLATRLAPNSVNCRVLTSAASNGAMDLSCVIQGGPASVAGKTVSWSRSSAGIWTCKAVDISQSHTSKQCPATH